MAGNGLFYGPFIITVLNRLQNNTHNINSSPALTGDNEEELAFFTAGDLS